MTPDLIARLRNRADLETACGNRTKSPNNVAVLCTEAADQLEALRSHAEALYSALRDVKRRGLPDRYVDDVLMQGEVDKALTAYRSAFPEVE